MIYTGYFAKLQQYQSAGLTTCSIARITPNWYHGKKLEELAPDENLLWKYKNREIDEAGYKRIYLQQLEHVKWQKILKLFDELNGELILLCYEKSDKFCHRHILSEYLRDNGIEIYEAIVQNNGVIREIVTCNKNCNKCKYLNSKSERNGQPWRYECLKYNDIVEVTQFQSTKIFKR